VKFPSIEQYGEALQFPENTILDAKLRTGKVQQDALGLPWGRSGAFALTFKITSQGKNFAFRCFQSQRDSMHERYEAISAFLGTHKTQGFVKFRYLDDGIKVQQKNYPTVIMDWSQGQSLGAYVEDNLRDAQALKKLRHNIEKLALALETAGIAHGDIQSQNILVDSTGAITLIDYDGMYVPALAKSPAIESGHRNFQHPQREKILPFDSTLDRFPFALIHTALTALIEAPGLWDEYRCHPEKLLFASKDLETPSTSKLFARLKSMPNVQIRATQLEAITKAKYANTPRFSDYLDGSTPKNPTAEKPSQTSAGASNQPWYMNPDRPSSEIHSQEEIPEGVVVDARVAKEVREHAGNNVLLVGKILSVEIGESGKGMPHAILKLLSSESLTVEVALWAEGIKAFAQEGITVDETWVFSWISVNGSLSTELGSSSGPHITLVVTQVSQIERITQMRASYLIKNGGGQSQQIQDPTRIEEETITSNENLIAGLGGSENLQNTFWGAKITIPAPTKSTTSSGAQTSQGKVSPDGSQGPALIWILVILGIVGLGILIGVIALAVNSYDDPSSSEQYQDSEMQQAAQTRDFDSFAQLFAGKCLTNTDQITECGDPYAASWVIDVVEIGQGCEMGTEGVRRSLGIVCIVSMESGSTTNSVQLETCIDLEFDDGPYAKCFPGEIWEYSGCWESANGAVLQQRLNGVWKGVRVNIAANDGCDTGLPWTVYFTHKESGVGVKQYRIYAPVTGDSQPITVNVS
jgi:hypothetical protein